MAFAKINECLDSFLAKNCSLTENWEDDIDTSVGHRNRNYATIEGARDYYKSGSPVAPIPGPYQVSKKERDEIRERNKPIFNQIAKRDAEILKKHGDIFKSATNEAHMNNDVCNSLFEEDKVEEE